MRNCPMRGPVRGYRRQGNQRSVYPAPRSTNSMPASARVSGIQATSAEGTAAGNTAQKPSGQQRQGMPNQQRMNSQQRQMGPLQQLLSGGGAQGGRQGGGLLQGLLSGGTVGTIGKIWNIVKMLG